MEGRPVQSWFDGLPPAVQDEICDLLGYLAKIVDSRWRRPEFDPLDGEERISELRPDDVFIEDEEGNIQTFTCRLYGFFGPPDQRNAYTLLHGTRKGEKNDKAGKRIANARFQQLERGEATVHEFEF